MSRFCLWVLLLASAGSLAGEEKDYQRYDLVREKNKLTIEGSLGYYTQDINESAAYTFLPQLGLEYTTQHHEVKGVLPYTVTLYNNLEAKKQVYYGFGDLQFSYAYLKQVQHTNLFFGGFCGIPLSSTNEYMLREGNIATGSGRYNLGVEFTATGIQDPIVWTLGLQYGIGLPKEERFYWSWEPGNIRISAGISTLFNDRFGLSLTGYQKIDLPEIKDGTSRIDALGVSTFFRPEVLLVSDDWYLRIGVEVYGYPVKNPIMVITTYGYSFEFPPKNCRN